MVYACSGVVGFCFMFVYSSRMQDCVCGVLIDLSSLVQFLC